MVTGEISDFFSIFALLILLSIMKQIFAIIACYFLSAAAVGQTSRALLVAIDNYPASGGWNEIHATNDISIVAPLLKANGFHDNHITVLTDAKATKENIVSALSEMVTTSRKGDYIYVQFSCHGQQMLDDNGDEPDGYDEALIPYDAQRRYRSGVYEGENHLRDDELAVFLDKIRLKIGAAGNLIAVFDACHSGSADRNGDDDEYVRGTAYLFAPDGTLPAPINRSKVIDTPKMDGEMAALTVLSACMPDEVNYEYKASDGKYYGTLTYAICSMDGKRGADMNITDFFGRLRGQIQKMQEGRKRKQNLNLESTNENKTFSIGR